MDAVENGTGLSDIQKKHHEKYHLRDMAMIALILDAGIRISEVNALNIEDFDRNFSQVYIQKRTINLKKETKEKLEQYIDHGRAVPSGPDDRVSPLFVTSDGRRLAVRSIQRVLKKYSSAGSNPQTISAEKLRDIWAPAKLLGINGILKFSTEILKWEKFGLDKMKLSGTTYYFQISKDGGTGDGIFRKMYGDFLIEAAVIMDNKNIAVLGKQFLEVAKLWDKIAEDLWQLSLSGNIYSRQMKSAVSIAPAAAAKRYISLCGCVHNFILSGQSFRPSVYLYCRKFLKRLWAYTAGKKVYISICRVI